MSAAYQVVSEGGLIVSTSRCHVGFPNHGNFRKMLLERSSPEDMLETIYSPGFSVFDQWQVQLFALILQRARVVFSSKIRHTGYWRDWSSDVCSSDLTARSSRTASTGVRAAGTPRPCASRRCSRTRAGSRSVVSLRLHLPGRLGARS